MLNSLVYILGGSEGLFAQKTLEINDEILSTYKNQGKFDMQLNSRKSDM